MTITNERERLALTVREILAGHGFETMSAARAANVVHVCRGCGSIVSAPDPTSAANARQWLDLSCCSEADSVVIGA